MVRASVSCVGCHSDTAACAAAAGGVSFYTGEGRLVSSPRPALGG